ncbi:MAG: S8 family serine peptidase [Bacteroidales bacterium]|nr:S8 family serine peptidase [Bacteroidales bacterium]
MKRFLLLFTLPLLALACAREVEVLQEVQEAAVPEDAEAAYVPSLAVVEFSDEVLALIENDLAAGSIVTKSSDVNDIFTELGIESARPVFPEEECPEEYRQRERDFGLRRFYYVEFGANPQPLTKAAESLAAVPGIIGAEPVLKVHINDVNFNDPRYPSQWQYNNSSVKGADVNCLPVWNNYTTGDPAVIVSVVDEGVDLVHPDLEWNCLPGGPNGSYNTVTGNYEVEPMSHGTHVAGTIAAVNNNGEGVCGIAGGDYKNNKPGVKIMSCQFFGTKGNGSSADAIRWGANHGAVISQNSWGYVADINEDGKISADELERAKGLRISSYDRAAVDYFITYAGCDGSGKQKANSPMKGGIVIFAAGNDNIPYGAPANYDRILAVGSMAQSGKKSDFSNYGDWVDICAPGSSILSTLPNGGYGMMSGTSMACPHVSGVAALVLSYCGGPDFTNDMLWTKLVNGANPDIAKTPSAPIGPMVDAYGAILYGSSGDPLGVEEYSIDAVSNKAVFTWNLTANSEGNSNYAAMLYASKNKALLEQMDPSRPGQGIFTASLLTSTAAVGDVVSGAIEGLEFETEYYVTLATYSYNRTFSQISPIKTVTTKSNNPPYIKVDMDPIPVHKNYEIWSIPLTIDDPDGHQISVEYKSGSEADSVVPDANSGGYVVLINGPKTVGGTYTGTITVTDEYGLSASATVTYTLTDNIVPVVKTPIDNIIFDEPGMKSSFNVADLFEDADGEPLSVEISVSDKSVAHAVINDGSLVVSSLTYGVSVITLTAYDAKRASVNMKFSVLIREAGVEVSTYPNPVTDYLYVSTGTEEEETAIALYGASGGLVYKGTQTTSAFVPAEIDMRSCAPGRYSVVFTYRGKEFKRTVIKK